MNWLKRTRGILPGREFFSSGLFWVPAAIVVTVALGSAGLLFWGQMNSIVEIRTEQLGTSTTTIRTETVESFSTTIRNIGLVVGGVVAVMLAVWRSLVAQRQADATLLQAQTAERQSRTTLRSFLNERYEQGSSRLGSDDLTVRLDGIDMLERLAREHPPEYHVQVLKRLSLFVRSSASSRRLHEEIQAAMAAIGSRSKEDIALETDESSELDLRGSNLQGLHLSHLNLSGSSLMRADLSDASLHNVDLSNADLQGANLKDAWLLEANLSGAQFSIAEGSYPAEGLTQEQLDTAHAYRDNPPKLDGVFDDDTGEQLTPPTREPGWLDELRELTDKWRQRESGTE